MSKFKVGDKVKCIYRTGAQNTKINSIYTVKGYRQNGNVIFEELPECAYDPEYFELVEESIKSTEVKIDASSITLTVDKIQNVIEKEGNKMIESMNLIDLYANKHKKSIEKETKEKVEEIRNKSSIKKQYDEITKKCIDDLNNLFTSQFSEEEREIMKERMAGCSDFNKEMKRKTSCCEFGYYIDNNFVTEEIEKLEQECKEKIAEIEDLVKTVKAHVGIAKTKEEVEEILTRYGIIDKKGKLVTK